LRMVLTSSAVVIEFPLFCRFGFRWPLHPRGCGGVNTRPGQVAQGYGRASRAMSEKTARPLAQELCDPLKPSDGLLLGMPDRHSQIYFEIAFFRLITTKHNKKRPDPLPRPLGSPPYSSKMKVTSMVTRYSSILPFFTLAFSSITFRPVIPRNVLFARGRPSWIAASKLVDEAAVIFDTLATAISASLKDWPPLGCQQADMISDRPFANASRQPLSLWPPGMAARCPYRVLGLVQQLAECDGATVRSI
jgi:hypothetical protein